MRTDKAAEPVRWTILSGKFLKEDPDDSDFSGDQESDSSSDSSLESISSGDNKALCHGSDRDACPQGRPGVARPSDTSAKNIGREECRESRRKHVDRSDGSGREH